VGWSPFTATRLGPTREKTLSCSSPWPTSAPARWSGFGPRKAWPRAKEDLAAANAALENLVQERTAKLKETVGDLEHFSYSITHDHARAAARHAGLCGLLAESCDRCMSPEKKDYLRRIATSAAGWTGSSPTRSAMAERCRQVWALVPWMPPRMLRGMIESYPCFQPPKPRVRIEGHIPPVLANEAGLMQCFSNLLGNARQIR